ncbi:MAG: tripartite tricarboxylate transporter substrate-binding protein [Betaproteobacteria bacterium]
MRTRTPFRPKKSPTTRAASGFPHYVLPACLRVKLCTLALLGGAAPGFAYPAEERNDYPVKPIRILVASPLGTASDFFARSVGRELSAFYRKRIIVENHPGAGGMIGNALVSKAHPDGYTLGMVDVSRITTKLMRASPPYRAVADIVAVAHVASITHVLVTTHSVLARTAPEFITNIRLTSGELNYASLGIGSASHLAGELFTRAVGIEAMHVPFRKLSGSFVDIRRGRVHYAIFELPAVLKPVHEGRIRALAVMTRQRNPALPAVPAIAEAGLPEAQFDNWSGIVAPKGTPRRVVEQLHGDVTLALRKAALRELFLQYGVEPTPESTPESFMRLLQDEYVRFQALIRDGGIKPE